MIVQEEMLREIVLYLRANLTKVGVPERTIRAGIDEMAPPTAGEEFIAVRCTSCLNEYPPSFDSKKIIYEVTISITKRVHGAPHENVGEAVNTNHIYNTLRPSLEQRAEDVIDLIQANGGWTLLNLINAQLTADGCFASPFGFVSKDAEPRKVESDHFDVEEEPETLRYIGLVTDVVFGGAEFYTVRPLPV